MKLPGSACALADVVPGQAIKHARTTTALGIALFVTTACFSAACSTVLEPAQDSKPLVAATFQYSCNGLDCEFDASESKGGAAPVRLYEWSFGDGVVDSGMVVQHRYRDRTDFTVVLTVFNDGGEWDSSNDVVNAGANTPTTWIYSHESIQAAVDAHPAGTEFTIKSGIHRLARVRAKDGNTFTGEPGAILSGAKILEAFTQEGGFWLAHGQTQQGQLVGTCDSELVDADGSRYTGCQYPEDLFIDDTPLFQVVSLDQVGPGKWFFDYAADIIYFQDDPTGKKVETSVTRMAFDPTADNVTIRGLVVEKYANPAQHGAIQGSDNAGPEFTRSGWVIEGNEVRLNHGGGIRTGTEARVVNNYIHHNGQIGMTGTGNNILVEDNEVAFNNVLNFAIGFEAGGTKFANTQNLTVRNNYVHHNYASGLWTDGNNIYTLYENNVVTDNLTTGIFHEISFDAVIRNNLVERNGFGWNAWLYGAGILIAHSPNVEVYGNTVRGNANGIAGIEQDRSNEQPSPYGAHILENLWVHDNVVEMTTGLTGVARDNGNDGVFSSQNNRFDFNTYYLGNDQRYFEWAGGILNESEWQNLLQDLNGSFVR